MEIPQEILDTGIFTADPEKDLEQMFIVDSYNIRMSKYRRRLKNILTLEKFVLFLNFFLPIFISVLPLDPVFIFKPRIEWLEWTALGVFAVGYIVLGLWKKKLIAVMILSALLILTDARLALVFVMNIPLSIICETKLSRLRKLEGYPDFRGIRIQAKVTGDSKADGEKMNRLNKLTGIFNTTESGASASDPSGSENSAVPADPPESQGDSAVQGSEADEAGESPDEKAP